MEFIQFDRNGEILLRYRFSDEVKNLWNIGILVDNVPPKPTPQSILYVDTTKVEFGRSYNGEDVLFYKNNSFVLEETVNKLGAELSQEKIKNMQKDIVITQIGEEISIIKLQLIQMKGSI